MFKKIFKKINKNELIKGGITLFVMINIFNALNWLFHFVMIRLLGKAEYGILAVLMSFVYIFTVPMESIQTIVSRYTSKFNLKKEYGKMKFLLNRAIKKCSKIALLIFMIFILASIFLKDFLDIPFWLFALTGLMLFGAFLLPITRGILQGRKKFVGLGTNMIFEASSKIILAIILVFFGLSVYGAVSGMIIGLFAAFLLSFLFLKEIINSKAKKENINGMSSYSISIISIMIAIVLMYSVDIILARRFFSPEIAGEYAAIAMLGKIIFFGTLPISKVMFPISSEKFEGGKETSHLLKKSLVVVVLLCLLALLVFLVFPGFIIKIWTGKIFVTPLIVLFYIGLGLSFLSLTNLIVLYGFSINKIKKSVWLFTFVLIEIILLSIFHNSVIQFSLAFLFANLLMFISSLVITKSGS